MHKIDVDNHGEALTWGGRLDYFHGLRCNDESSGFTFNVHACLKKDPDHKLLRSRGVGTNLFHYASEGALSPLP